MGELEGIYAVWWREGKVFLRQRERVYASIISPALWLFVFGGALGGSLMVSGLNYQQFVFPGITAMTLLFTSIFYGMEVIWDKREDLLKEVLVAPVSRAAVFAGKVAGGTSIAVFEGVLVLVLGLFLNMPYSPASILLTLVSMVLVSIGLVSVGLIIGASLNSPEGFGLVINVVMWPLFFFSGALYSVSQAPAWMRPLAALDPVTYGVDAIRQSLMDKGIYPLWLDWGVLLGFFLVAAFFGAKAFERIEQQK